MYGSNPVTLKENEENCLLYKSPTTYLLCNYERHGMKIVVIVMSLLLAMNSSARDIAGTQFDEKSLVNGTELLLNGGGIRKKFGVINVYAAGLYLPVKTNNADSVINAKTPRRILLVMKRDVAADSLLEALHDGLKKNLSPAEMDRLKPSLSKLDAIFLSITPREKDRIALDVSEEGWVKLIYNDQIKDALPGPEIGPALLKIWLGKEPVQSDLKKSLLAD